MTTTALDVWRSAKHLVDQHGTDTPIKAAQRADQLLAAGDVAWSCLQESEAR